MKHLKLGYSYHIVVASRWFITKMPKNYINAVPDQISLLASSCFSDMHISYTGFGHKEVFIFKLLFIF